MGTVLRSVLVINLFLVLTFAGAAQDLAEPSQPRPFSDSCDPEMPDSSINSAKRSLARILKKDLHIDPARDEKREIAFELGIRVTHLVRLRDCLRLFERRLNTNDQALLVAIEGELAKVMKRPDMTPGGVAKEALQLPLDDLRVQLEQLGSGLEALLTPTPLNEAVLRPEDRAQFLHLMSRFVRISTPNEDAAIHEIRDRGELFFFLFGGLGVWKEALAALESAGAYDLIASGLVANSPNRRRAAAESLGNVDRVSPFVVRTLADAIRLEVSTPSDIEHVDAPGTHLRNLLGLLSKFTALDFNVSDDSDAGQIELVISSVNSWLEEQEPGFDRAQPSPPDRRP